MTTQPATAALAKVQPGGGGIGRDYQGIYTRTLEGDSLFAGSEVGRRHWGHLGMA